MRFSLVSSEDCVCGTCIFCLFAVDKIQEAMETVGTVLFLQADNNFGMDMKKNLIMNYLYSQDEFIPRKVSYFCSISFYAYNLIIVHITDFSFYGMSFTCIYL